MECYCLFGNFGASFWGGLGNAEVKGQVAPCAGRGNLQCRNVWKVLGSVPKSLCRFHLAFPRDPSLFRAALSLPLPQKCMIETVPSQGCWDAAWPDLGTKDLIPPCILGVSGTLGWLRAAASPTALPHDGHLGCVALAHCPPHALSWIQTHLCPLGHWSFIPSQSWDVLRDEYWGAGLEGWGGDGMVAASHAWCRGRQGRACFQTANKSSDCCKAWKQTAMRQQLQVGPESVLRILGACSTRQTSCEMSLGCAQDLVIKSGLCLRLRLWMWPCPPWLGMVNGVNYHGSFSAHLT